MFFLVVLFFQAAERLGNEQLMEKMQDLEDSTARVSTGVPVVLEDCGFGFRTYEISGVFCCVDNE